MSANKTEKTQSRYNHWFWNSWIVNKLEGLCVRFGSYLWRKQYSRDQ